MTRTAFIYGDVLVGHVLSRDHPLVPARLRYTYELLEAYGAFHLEEARLVVAWRRARPPPRRWAPFTLRPTWRRSED